MWKMEDILSSCILNRLSYIPLTYLAVLILVLEKQGRTSHWCASFVDWFGDKYVL